MDLLVDGVIYQYQSHGGISRIFSEIFPRMCEMEKSLHITLFTKGFCLQSLPNHNNIYHFPPNSISRYLYPSWFWSRVIEKLISPADRFSAKGKNGGIWHSTYYTTPRQWEGFEVLTVYDMTHERFPDIFKGSREDKFRELKRQSVESADAIICISETTRQDLLDLYQIGDSKLIAVIPVAYNKLFRQLEGFELPSTNQISNPYILYVGGRHDYKNFHKLLTAFSLWSKNNEISLLVTGDKWTRDEKKRLVELNIKDKVCLFTNVNDEQLCWLYNQALGFIYPSLYEGFGIPLLEAMACGCPIVASRIPSTLEVAKDIPLYFDPCSVDSLISALDDVVLNRRASEKVQRGIEYVKNYSWERTARLTLDVYHSLRNTR